MGWRRIPPPPLGPRNWIAEVVKASGPQPPQEYSPAALTVLQARLVAEARDHGKAPHCFGGRASSSTPSRPEPVASAPSAAIFSRPVEPERFAGEQFEDTVDKLYGPEDEDPMQPPRSPNMRTSLTRLA